MLLYFQHILNELSILDMLLFFLLLFYNNLPYQYIRWIRNKDIDVKSLNLTSDTKWVQDFKGNNLLLFTAEWCVRWALDKNDGLQLEEFSRN